MIQRKYPVDGNTRVALPPRFENLHLPTLAEIGMGIEGDPYLDVYTDEYIGTTAWIYDITCELVSGGLRLPKQVATVDNTPWKGGLVQERPTRVGMSGAALTAFRFRPPDPEVLYNAPFRSIRDLIVRRGIETEVPWTIGDPVETYRVKLGLASPNDSDDMGTFTTQLWVSRMDLRAVVVA